MKMNMKKLGKMFLIFEFSISKLGYVVIFIKIGEKKFLTHFLRHFRLIKAKMKIKKHLEKQVRFLNSPYQN